MCFVCYEISRNNSDVILNGLLCSTTLKDLIGLELFSGCRTIFCGLCKGPGQTHFSLVFSNPSHINYEHVSSHRHNQVGENRRRAALRHPSSALTHEIILHYCYSHCSADLRNYFDIADRGSSNNIRSTLGFGIAIRDVLRLVVHGLMFAGVPCFSFVWVSRSNTGRSASCPLGNPLCESTAVQAFTK